MTDNIQEECPNSKEKGQDGYGLLVCKDGYLYDTADRERGKCNICEDKENN